MRFTNMGLNLLKNNNDVGNKKWWFIGYISDTGVADMSSEISVTAVLPSCILTK